MNQPELADASSSFGPVSGEQRWLASEGRLTATWVVTCVLLAVPQLLWWPLAGGVRSSLAILVLSVFVAMVPLMVYLMVKGDSVFPRWASAHGFSFEAKPQWPLPNWGIPPFNSPEAYGFEITTAIRGDVNGYPATYFHLSGKGLSSNQRYVFALELPARLPHLTLSAKLVPDRDDGIGYQAGEPVRPFYRYGADAQRVRAVFNPQTLDVVWAALPEKLREEIRFDTAGAVLIATTPQAFRAEQITAAFLAMCAICSRVPSAAWLAD
ncbi:hypothetical protein ABQE45_24130 [Mycobacteroides chelonae]